MVYKYKRGLKNHSEIESAVKELLSEMTLEEKAGQLCQSVGADIVAIGTTKVKENVEDIIRKGRAGSMIKVDVPEKMADQIEHLQKIAVEESRLGIPLLFCQDVIHGYETAFPTPLAWSCSFDTEKIEEAAEISGLEAGKAGLNMTFAPMVDIARDPRWGRVAEGAGEDPYLGEKIAEAQVRGFNKSGILCCLKHFAGYGAVEAGRDYNTVEISESTLQNVYLRPFRAGVDAGAGSVMAAFNCMDGIPMTAHKKMLQDVLRKQLGFCGIIISDYSAVMELMMHSIAEDEGEAAYKAFTAGLDIEMTSNYFVKYLPKMIKEGIVSEQKLDEAVARVLTAKYELGIMDNPFKAINRKDLQDYVFCEKNRKKSEELAEECIVLLENKGILPIKGNKIALIGPLADDTDLLGTWQFSHRKDETITIKQGLEREGFDVICATGCGISDAIEDGFESAEKAASQADIVVMALGESSILSGEACSRQNIIIPTIQRKLFECIKEIGKPIVLLVVSGRPLVLTEYKDEVEALVQVWQLGSNAGNAIAGVLSGRVNPSGALSMSFPATIGQIPVYYNELPTGRPFELESGERFQSKWLDGQNPPLYPFGYGLSYSDFKVSNLIVPSENKIGNLITVKATVKNESDVPGCRVIQLYIRDLVASISRPVKELKGFLRLYLDAYESKEICFTLTDKELGFYTSDGVYHVEPGKFLVFLGFSSRREDLISSEFLLKGDYKNV